MNEDSIIIHSDGGARGNPGPAACGFAAEFSGKVVAKESKYLKTSTNNIAEYEGVLLAAEWLKEGIKKFPSKSVTFFLDSELVTNQLLGDYKIKNENLKKINIRINKILEGIDCKVLFRHIPRSENKLADLLVNQELDRHR